MPNYCDYEMKVVGKTNCIKEFIKVMQADYNYGTNEFTGPRHMYRVFEAYVDQEPEAIDEYGNAECIISGYCAWSVASCMLDQDCTYYRDVRKNPETYGISGDVERRDTHLVLESKNLGLDIEVFSRETGMCFEEHYLIKHGEMIKEEVLEYHEPYWDKDEYPTMEAFNKEQGTNYTEVDFDENGFYISDDVNWEYEI